MRCNFIKLLLVSIVLTGANAKINVTQVNNTLQIESSNAGGIMKMMSLNDHKLVSKSMLQGSSNTFTIPANLKNGVYMYEIRNGYDYKTGMIKIENGQLVDNTAKLRKDKK